MRIIAFDDVAEFQRCARPVLGDHEPQYNLMIAVLGSLAEKNAPASDGSSALLALIEDEQRPLGLIVRTPPHPIMLSDLPEQAIELLATWLRQQRIELPGVVAPRATAERFIAHWSQVSQRTVHLSYAIGNHALQRVLPPTATPGHMRPATAEDFDLLLPWAEGFTRDVGHSPRNEVPILQRCIAGGGLWLWVDQKPVAMANSNQPTPNGIRINYVYTPPKQRRRGYATALVAHLSQYQLDRGRKYCFLFTDLANPTANRIYRKIGYERVCDYAEYRFE